MNENRQPESFDEVLRELNAMRGRLEELTWQVRMLQASQPPAPPVSPAATAPAKPASPVAPPPLPPLPSTPFTPVAPAARSPLMNEANRRVPPPASPAASTAKPPAPKSGASLEQIIGTRWMLIAGVAVVLLGGGFFFKYAHDMGWIQPPRRVLTGALFGLVALGLGEWAFRRKMIPLAAGLYGVGIVFWYYASWAASPNGPYPEYHMLSREWAFAAMCATSAIGLGISIRSNFILSALTAALGAMATPVLLSSGQNAQVFLLTYLVAVNGAFLAVAIRKRWDALAPVLALGTSILFAGWFMKFYDTAPTPAVTTAYGWVFLALHAVYILVGFARREWTVGGVPAGVLGIALVGILALAGGVCDQAAFCHLFAVQVFVLAALLLALAFRADAPAGAPAVVVAAAALVGLWLAGYWVDWLTTPACVYGWVLLAMGLTGLAAGGRRAWQSALRAQLLLAPALLAGVLLTCGASELLTGLPLQGQVIVLSALYLALGGGLNARWLALPAIAWTALAMAFDAAPLDAWLTWMWIHVGLFTLDVVRHPDRSDNRYWNIAQIAVVGSLTALALLTHIDMLYVGHVMAHALALEALVLGLALWRRWQAVRFLVLSWLVVLAGAVVSESTPAVTAWWLWAMFALLAADVQLRTWRRNWQGDEAQDAVLAAFSMTGMFAGTIWLLRGHWEWMGLYTTAWALAALATAWLVWRFRQRNRLAYSFLAQGLVLLILAVPIQFKGMWVPYFWALEALIAVVAARGTRNLMVLVACPIMLVLAFQHFGFGHAVKAAAHYPPPDVMIDSIAGIALAPSLQITTSLWTTIWLAGVCAAVAGVLRAGKALFNDRAETRLAASILVAGLTLLYIMACCYLPTVTATWWWLVPAAGLVVWSAWRASGWLAWVALAALLAASGKFVLYDTLFLRLASEEGPNLALTPVFNGQFASSAAMALVVLAALRFSRAVSGIQAAVRVFAGLIAAFLILWGGSFEIDRFFALHGRDFQDAALAAQMGYSIWWAFYAALVLVIGFLVRSSAARYFAMALFAVTLGK
ncbi:MAG: DUF2339 domain-containing protein, partial [Planctomycetota bacterium]|nr:DUF2339 domain-containing protein [Planctomycetota bacterium]